MNKTEHHEIHVNKGQQKNIQQRKGYFIALLRRVCWDRSPGGSPLFCGLLIFNHGFDRSFDSFFVNPSMAFQG